MNVLQKNGRRLALIGRDNQIETAQDLLDLFVQARYECGSDRLIVHKESLGEDFFNLRTGVAGELLQKCSNYRMRLAIVGDFSGYTSKSLRDFIYESNNGKDIFFVATEEEAMELCAAFIQLYRDQLAATLKLPASTSAAICYNDNVAVAFCAVLGERGLRVPADISVIGFDDLHAASAIPPLTTVSHMLEEMGAAAVDLLLDMIERTKRPRDLVVTPRLVIRASTASARRSAG